MESSPLLRNCVVCGKQMTLPYNYGMKRCCSDDCKRLYWLQNHPRRNANCLNCGSPLSYVQLTHRKRANFCSQKCNFAHYLRNHPDHQTQAGKKGGAATIAKYGGSNMSHAYSVLTPQLRREHKKQHDEAVAEKAKALEMDGFLVVFQDTLGKVRPDIIAYKDNIIYLFDVKTSNHTRRIIEEKIQLKTLS